MKLREFSKGRRVKTTETYHQYNVIARRNDTGKLTISILYGKTEMRMEMESAKTLSKALTSVIRQAENFNEGLNNA